MRTQAQRAARAELFGLAQRAAEGLARRGFQFSENASGGVCLADPRVMQRGYDPTRVPSRARTPGKGRAPSKPRASTSVVRYSPQVAREIVAAYRSTTPIVTTEMRQTLAWQQLIAMAPVH